MVRGTTNTIRGNFFPFVDADGVRKVPLGGLPYGTIDGGRRKKKKGAEKRKMCRKNEIKKYSPPYADGPVGRTLRGNIVGTSGI